MGLASYNSAPKHANDTIAAAQWENIDNTHQAPMYWNTTTGALRIYNSDAAAWENVFDASYEFVGAAILNGAASANIPLEAGFEYVIAIANATDTNTLIVAEFTEAGHDVAFAHDIEVTNINDMGGDAPTTAKTWAWLPTDSAPGAANEKGIFIIRKKATAVTDVLGGVTPTVQSTTGNDTLVISAPVADNILFTHTAGGDTSEGGYIILRRPLA